MPPGPEHVCQVVCPVQGAAIVGREVIRVHDDVPLDRRVAEDATIEGRAPTSLRLEANRQLLTVLLIDDSDVLPAFLGSRNGDLGQGSAEVKPGPGLGSNWKPG